MNEQEMNTGATYKLFNLPWYYFGIFSLIVLIATYTKVLPQGMAGCFAS